MMFRNNKALAAIMCALAVSASSCGSVAENGESKSETTTTAATAAPQTETETETTATAAETTTTSKNTEPEEVPPEEKDSDGITPYTEIKPCMKNGEFAAAMTQFTADLYRQTTIYGESVGKGALAGENDLISGCSAMLAFGMCANGMDGNTLEETLTALRMKDLDTLNSNAGTLMSKFEGEDAVMKAANGIWINSEHTFKTKQDYLDFCAEKFKSDVNFKPFNDTTKDEINSWVSDKTHGMIPSVIDSFDDDQVMALINCICFEDTWQDQIEEENVNDGIFKAADGSEQKCQMLHGGEKSYNSNDTFEGFVKKYSDSDFYFAAMLPYEGVTIDQAINSLSAESIADFLYRKNDNVDVNYRIPEFTYDYDTSLSESMMGLGCLEAFESGNFHKMLEYSDENGETVNISSSLQKTHIEFDRHGTKAAAATHVGVTAAGAAIKPVRQKKTIVFDRPFMYMIVYHGEDGDFPVFIGTVNKI
ncbi:serpin B [Ruminococcus sp. YE71]|uniref:serpin family protein n=1 Tax=unclassified Ruminococcus TaxID=2608920 RepID=UPI000890525B|nr:MULTISPECIES: serpin family protein [unclassified Ruminococcus]SDA17130.1 serpin B [Ruminococcus sp. YE78]SFW26251.1 serpin B [Ruminococcus sp. YE71]